MAQQGAAASSSATNTGGVVTPANGNGTPGQIAAMPSAPSSGSSTAGNAHQPVPQQSYTMAETVQAANDFFGGTTQGLAQAIQKAFSEFGEPNAYIVGNEGSGAFIAGLRYGSGMLEYKGGGRMPIYWQGPSIGFDFGGNASKVFMLVYNLHWTDQLFQRFPGIAGSLYVVAGVGLNYLRSGGVTVAPIRTGVGLRAGANVGYLTFTRKQTWNPF